MLAALFAASAAFIPPAGRFAPASPAPRTVPPRLVTYAEFVKEIRTFKAALLRALKEECGVPSEDTLACVDALAEVNPTAPDPATDLDLWPGEYTLCSSCLGLSADAGLALAADAGSASLEPEAFTLTFELRDAGDGDKPADPAKGALRLTGSLAVSADDKLLLALTSYRVELASDDAALLDACAAAAPSVLAAASAPTQVTSTPSHQPKPPHAHLAWHARTASPPAPPPARTRPAAIADLCAQCGPTRWMLARSRRPSRRARRSSSPSATSTRTCSSWIRPTSRTDWKRGPRCCRESVLSKHEGAFWDFLTFLCSPITFALLLPPLHLCRPCRADCVA